jgi:uncharacterized membrane protein YhdT
MEKPKIIKDVPVGVLILVLSQFMLYGVMYLAKFPHWWEFACIIFFTLVASDMIDFGIRLIKGYDVDTDK